MKKLTVLSVLILVFSMTFIYYGCDDYEELDECDKTEEPLISVGAIVNVTVVKNDGSPVVDAYLNVTISKIPCSGDTHGLFEFNGFTDVNGKFKSTVAYYNLGNSEDRINVGVTITGTGQSKGASYYYSSFVDGVTTDLYIKVYDNWVP